MATTTQCVKIGSLRKELKDPLITLEKWMEDPNNVYVGRRGRIFIGSGEDKRIFHYPGSRFENPFVVGTKEGQYSLEESLELYERYFNKSLSGYVEELRGKNLGCFCVQSQRCHAQILAQYLNSKN